MNINIITIFRSLNYGAVLQAYSLHKKLNDIGHNCMIIDYRTEENEHKFYKVFKKSGDLKINLKNIIGFFKYKETKRMLNTSNKFFFGLLKRTKRYFTYEELLADVPQADVYFCGSDQIWNPKITDLNPMYFLEFVNNFETIKASFAASIGENSIDKKYYDKLNKLLKDFDFISVREEKAKEIISEFSNKQVIVIADPVFLLSKDQWLEIATSPKIKEKYILCYFLYQPQYLNNILKKIKRETGYKIITITTELFSKCYYDSLLRDVGPADFIGLIANAEFVVTSSFHGTAFSILLEKQFYAVVSPERGSRILNILNKLDLEDRVISDNIELTKDFIEYGQVNKRVEQLRKQSMDYPETA